MRQRNDSGSVLHVSAWPTEQDPDRRPFAKGPGEEIDFPELLAGFTPLDAPDGEAPAESAPAEPVEAKPAKPTRSSKNTAASAAGGSEQP